MIYLCFPSKSIQVISYIATDLTKVNQVYTVFVQYKRWHGISTKCTLYWHNTKGDMEYQPSVHCTGTIQNITWNINHMHTVLEQYKRWHGISTMCTLYWYNTKCDMEYQPSVHCTGTIQKVTWNINHVYTVLVQHKMWHGISTKCTLYWYNTEGDMKFLSFGTVSNPVFKQSDT